MKRLTVRQKDQWILNEGVELNEALERLAKFEEFHAKMLGSKGEIVEELAKLRAEGKEKSSLGLTLIFSSSNC